MNRCLYHSSFAEFISADDDKILGKLWDEYHGVTLSTTKEALKSEITIMKDVVSSFEVKNGEIVFEYNIPRLGKRIDVVLLLNGIVFGLEFKVGKSSILEADVDQVLDYALDLKHFHKFSEDRLIVPILIATDYGNTSTEIQMSVYNDRIVNPLVTGENGLVKLIAEILKKFPDESQINPKWLISPYAPTPTIIEAATEIQVQGLELDYTCLSWDADMRYENGEWHFYKFNGQTRWTEQIGNTESKRELQKYMLNAYRVLLTRARAGMVICVPTGNSTKTASGFWEDNTRLPEFYDGTYQYLKSLGIQEI